MENSLSLLGERLRIKRKEKNLTLQKLADKTGLTAGLLSKIENLRTAPSLPVLCSIASALGTDMASLFGETTTLPNGKKWIHVKRTEYRPIDREENSGFHYDLILESRLRGDRQQLMLVTVTPDAKREPVCGDGTEIIYMVSGQLDYYVGEDLICLQPGDVLFFDSSVPHVPRNNETDAAVMLVIYYLNEPVF